MKRHLAVLTAVIALTGVAACDKDKDTPKPATSSSTAPSADPGSPDGTEASKPPLPTPGESLQGPDHRSESPAAS